MHLRLIANLIHKLLTKTVNGIFRNSEGSFLQGMQNMMCSSYPGHSCFIFDLYQQPFPGREEEEKYFQNYSPMVNQHIPRLGFLLWAERGAALGAGMGPQSAPSSPLPIPETTQPCSHQSFPPLFPNRAGFLGLGARGLWDGGCS